MTFGSRIRALWIPIALAALGLPGCRMIDALTPDALADAESLRSFLLMSEYEKRPRQNTEAKHLEKLAGPDHAADFDPQTLAVIPRRPLSEDENPRKSLSAEIGHLAPWIDRSSDEMETEFVQGPDVWTEQDQLTLEAVIIEAFHLNPSLEAVVANWEAVALRYPQVVSLDDPQFRYLTGVQLDVADNGSLNDFRQRYQVQQLIPFYGKRRLRGEIALAAADAASYEITATKVLLIEAAKLAWFDYLMIHDKAILHMRDRLVMDEYLKTLERLFADGLIDETLLRQAEIDRHELLRRQEQIVRVERLSRAKINTLLKRPPDAPLPPPRPVEVMADLPSAEGLRQLALENRPDLAATTAKIEAAETAVKLAVREFFPDVYAVGRFDVIDREHEDFLRTQFGFNVNVPIRISRRKAAYHEAQAALRKCRAEQQSLISQIQLEVQSACDEVCESLKLLELYPDLLGAAERKVALLDARRRRDPAAFREWIAAYRELIRYQAQHCDLRQEYYRRLIDLERMTGIALLQTADPLRTTDAADPVRVSEGADPVRTTDASDR